jgi:dihydroflavonol-4-reductase
MKTAVTGGSGVVGTAVVRHLIDEGHQVRAMARSEGSARKMRDLGADPVPGDILDGSTVRDLVDGCDWVFHVAGINQLCSRAPEEMWRVNVDGTRIALEACVSRGVRRMIHTSSAVTLGEASGEAARETSNHRGHFLSEYERSKWEAERVALGTAHDIDVVSVNPSSVQGPGRAGGTGALLLAAARGRMSLAVDATFSLVDIDDCARGHLLAAERGLPGQRYLLSGATLTTRRLISLLGEVTGRRSSPWYVRPSALEAVAPVVESIFKLLGMQAPLCAESARVLLSGHRYDGSRATRDLGLAYTPIEETLRRTVEWFREESLLRPGHA